MTGARLRRSGPNRNLAGGLSNLPNGETLTAEQLLRNDYLACLGEISVARLLNLYWTGITLGAPDVGGLWEVRTITNPAKGLLVRERDLAHRVDAPFILVHVDPDSRHCRPLGWNFARNVLSRGRRLDATTAVLPQAELKPWQ
jgi:hypothetical protein